MITDFYKQSISLKRKTGRDIDGKQITAVAQEIKARFRESSQARAIDMQGNEFLLDAEVSLAPQIAVELGDIIEYEGISYTVEKMATKRKGDGTAHHKKLYLKRTRQE